MTENDVRLKQSCFRILSGRRPRRADEWLNKLALLPAAAQPPDYYGSGGAVRALEQRTAALLGMDQGLFVIKGIIAQMAALRRLAEIDGTGC